MTKEIEKAISIPAINIQTAIIRVVGDSPLIMHKWSEKAKKEILDKHRSIVTVQESNEGPQQVRAFVHVEQIYKPISVVVNSEKQMAALLETALSELRVFKRKYETLRELSPVFDAIEEVGA